MIYIPVSVNLHFVYSGLWYKILIINTVSLNAFSISSTFNFLLSLTKRFDRYI